MNTFTGGRMRLAFMFFALVTLSALFFLSSCAAPAAAEASPSPAQVPGYAVIPSVPQSVEPAKISTATPVPTATLLPINYFTSVINDGTPDVKRQALLFVRPNTFESDRPGASRCQQPEMEGSRTIAYVGENSSVFGNLGDRGHYYGVAMINPKNCRYELVWAAPFARGIISATVSERENSMWNYFEPVGGKYGPNDWLIDGSTVIMGCSGKGSRPAVGDSVRVIYTVSGDLSTGKDTVTVSWIAPISCPDPGVKAYQLPKQTPATGSDLERQIATQNAISTSVFGQPGNK